MTWLCTVVAAIFLGLSGNGWFWLPLVLLGAFLDVGYARPQRERERAERLAWRRQLENNPELQEQIKQEQIAEAVEKYKKRYPKGIPKWL